MIGSMERRLARAINIDDLRELARKRLPRAIFGYLDGGAEDEITLRDNIAAFERHRLVPKTLVDVATVDTSTTVLGERIEWPVMIAPTGMSRLFHHDGERAVARAAAKSGTYYSLSSLSTVSIEDVAKAAPDCPKLFQIYVLRDRAILKEFIDRARAAGYKAMCLTVDVAVAGNRERDLRNGMTLPPNIGPRTVLDGMMHPNWSWHYLTKEAFSLANIAHLAPGGEDMKSLVKFVAKEFDSGVTWDDAAWIAEQWDGPFVIKGILSAKDAIKAASVGATAVWVSNHGGRQLDGVPAPIDIVAEIADAVGDQLEIILDSGIRRGTHVLKAIARGATACMIGRAYLYGLGAGGEAGVDRALAILRAEVERDMKLLGCTEIKQINSGFIR